MARIRICGFEMGDFSDIVSTSGTVSVVSSPARTGGYALRANPTTTGTGYAWMAGFATSGVLSSGTVSLPQPAYFRFYFRYATKPGSNSEEICRVGNTNTGDGGRRAALRLNSDGTLSLYNSANSAHANGSTVLSANTWYRLELKIGYDSAPGVDDSVYELKIDGVSEFSGSNLNGSSTNTACNIMLGKASNNNSQTVDFFYDDFAYDDSAYPGEGEVQVMQPNAAGNYSGATAGTYADVDELPHDSDTTYLTWTSNTNRHSVNLESSSAAGISGTIGYVQPYVIARSLNASASALVVGFIRTGTTDTDSGTGIQLGTSYTFIGGKVFAVDPQDSAAWTTTKLDSLEVGAYVSASSATERRVTAMGVMVEYIPAATTKAPVLLRRAARWFSSRG